jgi:hypothetical protein
VAIGLSAVSGAWPIVVQNAPAIWKAAQQLAQLVKGSKEEFRIGNPPGMEAALLDNAALKAVVDEVEASLLTLNQQVSSASDMIASLALANDAMTTRLQQMQKWLIACAVVTIVSITLALVSLIAALAQ